MTRDKTKQAAIDHELNALASRQGGRLTVQEVLDLAQNPESALHSEITWDDTEAARLRRLDEATGLIESVTTEVRVPVIRPVIRRRVKPSQTRLRMMPTR